MSYDKSFFDAMCDGSFTSATNIVPRVLDLVAAKSVVDIGCARGHWLAAFQKCGISDIVGTDGDYVNRNELAIPLESFIPVDLSTGIIPIRRRFDLAICLEVAEHLPQASAANLVDSLTALSPVVMFSAAVPGQGGEHHINEQWPDYWYDLFVERDYTCIDALRMAIWHDPKIEWWYKQNLLIFVDNKALANYPKLEQHAVGRPASFVHPDLFLRTLGLTESLTALSSKKLVSVLASRTINKVFQPAAR